MFKLLIIIIFLLTSCSQTKNVNLNKAKNKINNILEKNPELVTKFDTTKIEYDTCYKELTYYQTDTLIINTPIQILQSPLQKDKTFSIDNNEQKILGQITGNNVTLISEIKPKTIIKHDTIKIQDTCFNIVKTINETKFVNNQENNSSKLYYLIKKNLIWLLLFLIFIIVYNSYRTKSIY